MNYWLNIHHPPEEGEGNHNVCLQEKNGRRYLRYFSSGDYAFIYETRGPQEVVVEDEDGRRTLRLREGRKGIIALVKVRGKFRRRRWRWDDKPFIGYFNTRTINTSRNFVSLDRIRRAWSRASFEDFNPRINGGLRKLTREEYVVLKRLVSESEKGQSR